MVLGWSGCQEGVGEGFGDAVATAGGEQVEQQVAADGSVTGGHARYHFNAGT